LTGLGEALYGQSRYEEAIKSWREAIDGTIGHGMEKSDDVARLYGRLARASWAGGDTPRGLVLCQEGLDLVGGSPEGTGLALLLHEAARAYLFNGLAEEAEPFGRRALEMAERLGVVELQAEALATVGLFPGQSADAAIDMLERAVTLAESAGLLSQAARAHNNLAATYSSGGEDLGAALDHYRQAAEQHQMRGDTVMRLLSLGGVADSLLKLGDMPQVEETLRLMRKLLGQVVDPGPTEFILRSSEAALYRYRGDYEKAADVLRVLQDDARRRDDLHILLDANSQLGELLLEPDFVVGTIGHSDRVGSRVERWREADAALVEALEICERWSRCGVWQRCLLSMVLTCQGRLSEARQLLVATREQVGAELCSVESSWLLLSEARAAAAEERWTEALTAYEGAAGIYARLGMKWWWARVLQEWAETHYSRKELTDLERARALFREALALYKEVGVPQYERLVGGRLLALRAEVYQQAEVQQLVAQELATAGRVQEGLLPGEAPSIPGWQLAVILVPAKQTSGDFYDLIPLTGERLGIVVADVADKGMGAALYMALSRTLIRTYAMEHPQNPELVVAAANQRIMTETQSDMFVTLFYGALDPATGELVYCNAGHNPPYLVDANQDSESQALRRTGMPLGIVDEVSWEARTVQILPGGMLVLYTDGVTEAQNVDGNLYGERRLLSTLDHMRLRGPDQVLKGIISEVETFVGGAPQFDDLTLMVLTRDGAGRKDRP
jgi:serine phosphatase RsbU (regulator of sigma subunit)